MMALPLMRMYISGGSAVLPGHDDADLDHRIVAAFISTLAQIWTPTCCPAHRHPEAGSPFPLTEGQGNSARRR